MAGESKITTDHELIKKWAEDRGGIPVTVRGTRNKGEIGLLRFDFVENGEGRNEALEEITWEQFFDKFEEKKLALLYQDETSDGKTSRFFKFVARKE